MYYGINYQYIKELAPTNEIRQKQKEADKVKGETKKQRTTLGQIFKSEYNRLILEPYDIDNFIYQIKTYGAKNIVFFCVEEYATACHRSLVAQKIAEVLHCEIINL